MNQMYSIIIPVYNAQKYLANCVDSVLRQDSASDYEISLVDDGSRDNSSAICDRLTQQNARIRVIHQANQGVSAARNTGIAAAKGNYILFLDSDDSWDSGLLSQLDALVCHEPDIIEFGYLLFDECHVWGETLPEPMNGDSGKAALDACIRRGIMPMGSSCMAAYKREYLIENNLQFALGVRYGEDLEFKVHCLLQAKSMYSVQKILYRYRMHEESAVHTPSVEKVRDVLTVCAGLYRLYPNPVFANYYCMNILKLANLNSADAGKLKGFLKENSDILQHISGRKTHIARTLYRLLGWRQASRLVLFGVKLRHSLQSEGV